MKKVFFLAIIILSGKLAFCQNQFTKPEEISQIPEANTVILQPSTSNGNTNSNSYQTDFCKGWEDGYKDGWCYGYGYGCLKPIAPICPVPNYGEVSYKDGYNRGFLKGREDHPKN